MDIVIMLPSAVEDRIRVLDARASRLRPGE